MNQEAVLNCVICNHLFDWNKLEYCPNCNWQQIDYIGDMEHTAVLLRPEREAWIAKKKYKVTDFSYEGYVPALMEAMKNQFTLEDFDIDYKVTPFFREWFEDNASFDLRLSEKPIFLGEARFLAKLYNPQTGQFPIEIQWQKRIKDEKQSDQSRYFISVPKEQAKAVFDSAQFPPIYLHLRFDELKQIHAEQAFLVTNNQIFEISLIENINLLEISGDNAEIPEFQFKDNRNQVESETLANPVELKKIFNWLRRLNHNLIQKNIINNLVELNKLEVLDLSQSQISNIPNNVNLLILPHLKEIIFNNLVYSENRLNQLIPLKKKGVIISGLNLGGKLAKELAKH